MRIPVLLALGSWFCIVVALSGCGAGNAESGDGEDGAESLAGDGSALLVEVAGGVSEVLTPPSGSIEELEGTRRAARGTARRVAERDLARAHLFAIDASTGRERRAHVRAVQELTSARVRDAQLSAELDLIGLWGSWRSGAGVADGRAQRFIAQHDDARDLALLAWLVRGEIAFARQRWDDALEAFRATLGRLGHPLYAYGLYRSALVWRALGRDDDTRQALAEVRDLGCGGDAAPGTVRVAVEAARALGEGVSQVDGRQRPEHCASGEATQSTSAEDERPPGVR